MININKIGELLTKARKARSLDLHKVSEDLRIRKKYLEAIESGSVDEIPGDTYAQGYIKMYADYLGVSDEILNTETIKRKSPINKVPNAQKHIDDNAVLGSIFGVLVLVLIILVCIRNEKYFFSTTPQVEEIMEDKQDEF